MADTPNPGSPEAVEQGCKCPRIDNRHGAGLCVIDGERLSVIAGDCPLHGFEPASEGGE